MCVCERIYVCVCVLECARASVCVCVCLAERESVCVCVCVSGGIGVELQGSQNDERADTSDRWETWRAHLLFCCKHANNLYLNVARCEEEAGTFYIYAEP